MKKCTKCEIEKPEDDFSIRRKGLNSQCRSCVNNIRKENREKNKDKVNEKRKLYYEKNKEKLINSSKKYQKENKDKVNKNHREWWKEKGSKYSEIRTEKRKNLDIEQKQKIREYQKLYVRKRRQENEFAKRANARIKIRNAIVCQKIKKSKTCQICGKKTRIEAHHADYDKPLEVIWLCRCCHMALHRRLKKLEKESHGTNQRTVSKK